MAKKVKQVEELRIPLSTQMGRSGDYILPKLEKIGLRDHSDDYTRGRSREFQVPKGWTVEYHSYWTYLKNEKKEYVLRFWYKNSGVLDWRVEFKPGDPNK